MIKKYSAKFKSIPVIIESEDGTEVTYKLVQFSGSAADDYKVAQAAKVALDKNGDVVEIKDFRGQYTDLLSRTLKGPDDKFVPAEKLNEWPDELLKDLYKESAILNKFQAADDENEEADPKKS